MRVTPPTQVVSTAPEDRQINHTLKAVANYLNRLVENKTWSSAPSEPAFEIQRLAASAHQAIASQPYDTHATYVELSKLKHRAEEVFPSFWKAEMHPRVLTVLLRVLVNGCSAQQWESETLAWVKSVFRGVAKRELTDCHPVTLLFGTSGGREQARTLLWRLISLIKADFYAKLSQTAPIFVAREEIYTARVLASLGFPEIAHVHLEEVIRNFSLLDDFTIADTFRTIGFAKFQAGHRDEAVASLLKARELFNSIQEGGGENAMYNLLCLGWVFRNAHDLAACEYYLWEALQVWESNSELHQNQGGVKLVRDLEQVCREQQKYGQSMSLKSRYPSYFEESRWLTSH